jgi:CDP-diglyceride synthetase
MLGDSFGSYIKRRRGLKREGETSSRAPLLDTIPFALAIFIAAFLLFPDQIFTHSDLRPAILGILILTPLIHRAFNILGHRLGLKSVPY